MMATWVRIGLWEAAVGESETREAPAQCLFKWLIAGFLHVFMHNSPFDIVLLGQGTSWLIFVCKLFYKFFS